MVSNNFEFRKHVSAGHSLIMFKCKYMYLFTLPEIRITVNPSIIAGGIICFALKGGNYSRADIIGKIAC